MAIEAELLPPRKKTGNKNGAEDVIFTTDDNADMRDEYDKIFDDVLREFNANDETQSIVIKLFKVVRDPALKGKFTVPWIMDFDHSDKDAIRTYARDKHGSGRYRIMVFVNGKAKAQKDFDVLADERPAPSVAVADGETKQLAAIVDRLFNRLDDVEKRLIERPPVQPMDPMDMFSKMATAVGALMGARPPAPVGPDPLAMLESVTKVAGLLVDARGNGGAAETNIYDLAKGAIEAVGPQLAQAMAQRPALAAPVPQFQQQPQARPMMRGQRQPMMRQQPQEQNIVDRINAQPFNGTTQEQPVAQTAPSASAFEVGDEAQGVLRMLVRQASRHTIDDGSPQYYAEYVFDNLPEPMIDYILDTPNVLDQLGNAFPGIVQFRPWFAALVDAMRGMTEDDPGAPEPQASNVSPPVVPHGHTGGAGGDRGNAQIHGTAGPAGQEEPRP